jgi:hypothetical protein
MAQLVVPCSNRAVGGPPGLHPLFVKLWAICSNQNVAQIRMELVPACQHLALRPILAQSWNHVVMLDPTGVQPHHVAEHRFKLVVKH